MNNVTNIKNKTEPPITAACHNWTYEIIGIKIAKEGKLLAFAYDKTEP